MWSKSKPLILLSALGALFELVFAQQSSVTCDPTYQWAVNSLNQNPCLVAAYLRGVCITSGASFNMGPLAAGSQYLGPTKESQNPCECNTVVYSLVGACSSCQSRNFGRWSSWSANCSSTTDRNFPLAVPPATVIPPWALLDVTKNDIFSAVEAEAAATSLKNSSTPAGPHLDPASLMPSKPSKPENIVGIVLGIVGGMIIFGGVGALVIIQTRKKNKRRIIEPVDDYSQHKVPSEVYPMPSNVKPEILRTPDTFSPSTKIRPLPTIPHAGLPPPSPSSTETGGWNTTPNYYR